MKQKNTNSHPSLSHMDIIICSVTGFLLLTTILSGIILSSSTTHADNSSTDSVSVTVGAACTLTATGGGTYSGSVTPGSYTTITGSTLSTVCNDPNGYSLYAIGYSGDSYDAPTNTQMIGAGGIGNIVTGTAKSGNTSNWAMQVTPTSGSDPTITNGFDSANFHVVPEAYTQVAKYTSTTASATATGARVNTKYQVYITSAQIAGTYTGKVKYTMVHPNDAPAPEKPKPYIKDFTNAMCQSQASSGNVTVVDERDNNEYTVRYINGACWMTSNLRYTGDTGSASGSMVMKSATSNITADKTLTYTDLTSDNEYHYTYTEAKVHSGTDLPDGNATEWYNYCAASAGTVCSQTKADATQDICPNGWHLPTDPQFSGITSYKDAFSPVTGGYYNYGSLGGTGNGYWWSATANDANAQCRLGYDGSSLNINNTNKYFGFYVRCVRSS